MCKNYALGSFHQAMEFFEILFNRTKFNTLSDDLKAILEYTAEAASSSNTWTAQKNHSKDLQALIVKDKVRVSRTSREVFAAQLEAWDKVTTRLESEDPFFKEVNASAKAWAKKVAYYSFFNEADFRMGYEHTFKVKLPRD